MRRTLRSIFDQSFQDYRVIIVDDGSPVPAEEELSGLPEELRRKILIIVQPNQGASAARNRGLDEVSNEAEFVAFIDSDDLWTPEHLARAANIYKTTDADMFWDSVAPEVDFERYRKPAELIPAAIMRSWASLPGTHDVLDMRRAMFGQWWRFIHLSVTTLSRRLAINVRFPLGMHVCEDFAFLYQCALKSTHTVCSEQIGMRRGTGANIWHGAQMHDEVFAKERATMIGLLKQILAEPNLEAGDKELISSRIQIAREQLYWAIRSRMKHREKLNSGLVLGWFLKDPALFAVALGYALKIRPHTDKTVIPGDNI